MKFKRYNFVPLVLLVYLAVMVYLGYPGYVSGATSPALYFGGTAFTLVVIILLRFNLKKRIELRRRRQLEEQKLNDKARTNDDKVERP